MKRILSFLLFLLVSVAASAQRDYSSVYMKDGSIVEGRVIYENSDNIVLLDRRREEVVPVGDIVKILPWKDAESQAPENSVSLDVGYAFSLGYERRMFTRKMSLGANLSYVPKSGGNYYTGYEFQPKYRYYIYGEANSYGFYLQGKLSLGYYGLSASAVEKRLNPEYGIRPHSYTILKNSFMCFGASLTMGYLFRLGKRCGLELYLGTRYMSGDKSSLEIVTKHTDDGLEYTYRSEVMSMDDYVNEHGTLFIGGWTGQIAMPFESGASFSVRF